MFNTNLSLKEVGAKQDTTSSTQVCFLTTMEKRLIDNETQMSKFKPAVKN